ncbi:MAG: hypothetical protein ABJG55_16665 [Paracoccaceae bacterium]
MKLEGDGVGVTDAVFSSDGTKLTVGYYGGLVRRWDIGPLRPPNELIARAFLEPYQILTDKELSRFFLSTGIRTQQILDEQEAIRHRDLSQKFSAVTGENESDHEKALFHSAISTVLFETAGDDRANETRALQANIARNLDGDAILRAWKKFERWTNSDLMG